jgi:hypothetical protein
MKLHKPDPRILRLIARQSEVLAANQGADATAHREATRAAWADVSVGSVWRLTEAASVRISRKVRGRDGVLQFDVHVAAIDLCSSSATVTLRWWVPGGWQSSSAQVRREDLEARLEGPPGMYLEVRGCVERVDAAGEPAKATPDGRYWE